MTYTEAQIEAVAKIVAAVFYRPAPDMSGDIWKAVGPGVKQRCTRVAEDILIELPDALTAAAAAEAGWPSDELIADLVASATEEDSLTKIGPYPGPSKVFDYISGKASSREAELEAQLEHVMSHCVAASEVDQAVAAAIERCAQKVEECKKRGHFNLTEIAAAIRALKDKP